MRATVYEPLGHQILRKAWLLLALLATLLIATTTPALAHTDHKKKTEAAAQIVQQPGAPNSAAMQASPTAMDGQMGGTMMDDMKKDRSKMTSFERLLDWLGRLHPMIVHFPIAFFPAALFMAIVGRRRPDFAKPVQFLVVAGGIIAPIAAVLGWLDGGFDFATDDMLLQNHRWLGTGIGVGALGLAIWALRKPQQDRSVGMIVGLTIITAAIVVQGWFGGALVHGMDHLNW